MKRSSANKDMDELTECADDISLYSNSTKKSKFFWTNTLQKYMPKIIKKTRVDYLYMAISEILQNEKTIQLSSPTQELGLNTYKNILYILSQQDIFDIDIVNECLYCDDSPILKKDISYGIHLTDELFEAMIPLQNPVCLWIQCGKYGFCMIRELHSPSIILKSKITPHRICNFYDRIQVDTEFIDDLIWNSNVSNKCKKLCCSYF